MISSFIGVQLADLDGDGRADYLWVNPKSGAVIAYLNKPNTIIPVNGGKEIASGGGPGAGVSALGAFFSFPIHWFF